MPYFESTPQTSTIYRNYLSIVDIDFLGNSRGSGVYIGNGIILTAGHVITAPGLGAIIGAQIDLAFAEGEEWSAFGGNIDYSGFTSGLPTSDIYLNSFTNFGAFGAEDLGLVRLTQPSDIAMLNSVPQNRMLIFSDPNDAIGQVWTAGYVGAGGPSPVGNGETVAETFSNSVVNLIYSSGTFVDNFGNLIQLSGWNIAASTNYQLFSGFSGSGFWLNYDLNNDGVYETNGSEQFLVGIVSLASPFSATIEPIGDAYHALASLLFNQLGMNPNDFATNVLIADADGFANGQLNNTVIGTGFNEEIYGSAGDDIIIASGGSDIIHGGAGSDTVDYRGLPGGVTATINGTNASVIKSIGGTDTLDSIELILGTAQADAFNIVGLAAGAVLTINGGSPFGNNQVPLQSDNALGARVYSGADILAGKAGTLAGLAPGSELVFSNHNNDTITLSQDLINSGAQVTYLSAQGEGLIWLEVGGVMQRISYTGIFNEASQTQYFAGLTPGATVGLSDTGSVMLDFSNSTQAIDSTVLAAIPLFNLVDEFIGSNLGDTIDLALTAANDNREGRVRAA